jgi:microsomal epoxide hydrolase
MWMRALAVALSLALGLAPPAHAHAVQAIPVADGVTLRVVTEGARTAKPTLVLVPGWSFTADIWRDQMRAFATDRQVVSFDPRSQGASTKTAVGDTPEQRAADLEALLTRLDLKSIVLVGWSQGGQDVAAYVNRYGTARLKGAVIVDTAISPGAPAMAKAPEATAAAFGRYAIYAQAPHDFIEGMIGAIITRPLPAAERAKIIAASEQTPPAIGLAMLVADMFGTDRTAAIAKFTCPTLVIASATSPELAGQKAMAARMPNARFVAIPDAAHTVFVDQPDRFEMALRGFLAEVDRRAG